MCGELKLLYLSQGSSLFLHLLLSNSEQVHCGGGLLFTQVLVYSYK